MFQFPSNGKDFPNWTEEVFSVKAVVVVSIPFKREGLSERMFFGGVSPEGKRFQFPSNGKDFPNVQIVFIITDYRRFNSLQTGRTFRTTGRRRNTRGRHERFNSLQTGRTFRTKVWRFTQQPINNVSIPFKREGLSELMEHADNLEGLRSFNSLQTGRTFRTNAVYCVRHITDRFQFPSNGKDFPNFCR